MQRYCFYIEIIILQVHDIVIFLIVILKCDTEFVKYFMFSIFMRLFSLFYGTKLAY